jgi:hypothetical protein
MKLRALYLLVFGFLMVQAVPAGAVLQSKPNSDNPASSDNVSSSSQLISNQNTVQDAAPASLSAAPGGAMKLKMKFSPKKIAASQASAPAAADSDDDHELGKPTTQNPNAVVPDFTSPVVKTVSGPVQNAQAVNARMRSTQPTQMSVSAQSSTKAQQ